MRDLLRWASLLLGLSMAAGTLLNLSRSPHWFVRGWDFPRVQIAGLAALAGGTYAWCCAAGTVPDRAFLAVTAATVLWQLYLIHPYTPLAPRRVQWSRRPRADDGRRLRLLIANVQMENTRHDAVLRLVRETAPDVVLAVETDERWVRALEPLTADYPHAIRQPQDNWFGLVLFSRLPLLDARTEFVVQDDIPSVVTAVRLGDTRVVLRGLHPRPPEPVRDQDSTPRDAELVLVGRRIAEQGDVPTVVAGDLNDVAWSATTRLFLRLSGLLDPRMGRGLYSTYHARNPLVRWPLDHVFHSHHFRLVELRRCGDIGSDHFPVLIELSYEPDAAAEQPRSRTAPGDTEAAGERVEAQHEAARTGDDRPGREE